MATEEDIHMQQQLLQSHRQTLAHYLNQYALLGVAYAPPAITHGITNARDNIRRIKAILRGWGISCEDAPDDEATAPIVPSMQQNLAAGIPQELLMAIRRELPLCDEFQSHARLRVIFVAEELRMWQPGLPEADSLQDRVDLTIEYLRDKQRSDGRHALALFLTHLSDRYDHHDARYARLMEIAARVSAVTT